mmetsp:Transcript_2735/g.6621  ORF Transcript_2735/g.6621 Transcript_2735/m.6621 type:complete len:235 (-) Transcript_2735:367-1071(-)
MAAPSTWEVRTTGGAPSASALCNTEENRLSSNSKKKKNNSNSNNNNSNNKLIRRKQSSVMPLPKVRQPLQVLKQKQLQPRKLCQILVSAAKAAAAAAVAAITAAAAAALVAKLTTSISTSTAKPTTAATTETEALLPIASFIGGIEYIFITSVWPNQDGVIACSRSTFLKLGSRFESSWKFWRWAKGPSHATRARRKTGRLPQDRAPPSRTGRGRKHMESRGCWPATPGRCLCA